MGTHTRELKLQTVCHAWRSRFHLNQQTHIEHLLCTVLGPLGVSPVLPSNLAERLMWQESTT